MLRGDAKTLKFNQKTMIDKKKALKFVRGRKKEKVWSKDECSPRT